jgi:hypothetical protein
LLVEDADRLSRQDWKKAMDFVEEVLDKGAEIVTLQNGNRITSENFRDNPGVFLQLILNAHLGHVEDTKKASRVKDAWAVKQAEIRSGAAIRQRLPGWLYHQKSFVGGKVVLGPVRVNQSKAATVREIFRLTLAGWGSRRIAKDFNARGVPSVSGQSEHWNGYSLLACIIRNPAVIGDYQTAEGQTIKGLLPAIVDEKTFYAANAAASRHRKLTTPSPAVASNLATGLVRCPTCGGNMSRHRNHAHGKVYSYLVCAATKAGAQAVDCTCRPHYDAFEAALLALMCDSATLRKALGQPVGEPTEWTALKGRLEATDRKLNELMPLLESTPSQALAKRVQQIELEAEALRREVQAKEVSLKATVPPAVAYDQFVSELAAHMHEPEYRERVKTCLRSVIDHIQMLDKNSFTVHFKGGTAIEVWMAGGCFRWDLARRVGRIAVP